MTRSERPPTSGITLAFAAAAISGFAVFINAYGVRAVPDASVYTTAKNLIAAAILLPIALVATELARHRTPLARPPRTPRSWAGLMLVGLIGGSVPFVLFFEGLSRASSTHAAFLQKTMVIWVALLALPLLGERLRAVHVVAIGLLLTGLVLLDGNLRGFAFGSGEGLILAATLLWAGEVIVAKRLLRSFSPTTVAATRMGLGVLVLLGWVAYSGRWGTLAGLSANGWTWALLTGAILAGYVTTWLTALSRAKAIDVTAILIAGAVLTGLLNTLVKGAPMPVINVTGLAAVLAGTIIVAAYGRQRVEPVPVRSR